MLYFKCAAFLGVMLSLCPLPWPHVEAKVCNDKQACRETTTGDVDRKVLADKDIAECRRWYIPSSSRSREESISYQCCLYEEFRYCLGDSSVFKVNAGDSPGDCTGYSYPSISCFFFLWLTYITVAAVAFLVLILVCSCLVKCRRDTDFSDHPQEPVYY